MCTSDVCTSGQVLLCKKGSTGLQNALRLHHRPPVPHANVKKIPGSSLKAPKIRLFRTAKALECNRLPRVWPHPSSFPPTDSPISRRPFAWIHLRINEAVVAPPPPTALSSSAVLRCDSTLGRLTLINHVNLPSGERVTFAQEPRTLHHRPPLPLPMSFFSPGYSPLYF